MATPTVQNRVRIAGAGFTLFTWAGQPVAFCEQVAHTSPRPISPPSNIHPMDEPYVVEILMAPAAGPGTLVLNLFELFGSNGNASKVWDRLGANTGNTLAAPFGSTSNLMFNTSQFLSLTASGNGPFTNAVDIVDILIKQAQATPSQMAVSKIVRPLPTSATTPIAYSEDYIGCVITDVVDGETVAVGTKEVIKQITVQYRYLLRNGVPSGAFALRDQSAVASNDKFTPPTS